jgi:soluble lytic murein transglycosylase
MPKLFPRIATLLPTLLAVLALASEPTRAKDGQSAVRGEFVAAMERVREHQADLTDSPALRSYALHDYLVAERLSRDLQLNADESLDERIDQFLKAHAGQPVSRPLRAAWLASLADRARWDWFLPRSADVADPALACARLQARLATGETQGLADDALERWSLPHKQPPACDAVFDWLRSQGLLTADRAESRTRAALDAGNAKLARQFASDVPAPRAEPLLQWAQLLETPRSLQELATNTGTPVEPEALLAGFGRLARVDSAAAAGVLPKLLERPDVTPPLAARLQRMSALGSAYDHDPEAMTRFASLPAEALDADAYEWRVRTALWAGDYNQALLWLAEMPQSMAAQPRWRYWRARALEATSGPKAAEALLTELARTRDFYGYLAADRLHRRYALNARAVPEDAGEQARLAVLPGMVRARELFECDMVEEAIVEWAAALSDAPPAVRVQAAQLAAQWGWYAQSITSLAQAGEYDDVHLRYPRPYSSVVAHASKLTRVPPDWILAVMRQESLFRSDAISKAGARGLMQLLPATASAVARRWHLPPPSKDGLFEPKPGVLLGAAYLSELLERFDGQLGPSLAAYNAGPNPVNRWLPAQSMDADVWIENIPYGETRNYVQRVFEHIVAFAYVRDAHPPHLAKLLPPVESAASSAGAAPLPHEVLQAPESLLGRTQPH